jgi:hypothetical protein
MRVLLLGVVGLALLCGGCAYAMRQQIESQLNADLARCNQLYPDPYRRPIKPRVQCINEAQLKARSADPNLDLWNALAAEYVVFAEQYDAGKMTKGQYGLAESKTMSEYTSRAFQRQSDTMAANAGVTQADGALAQAWAANRPVTCNRIGNTATCY